jgi:predicted O-methyltransferase YrrM
MIPRFVIDSTDAVTELCILGDFAGADKSPINHVAHRHPYTPVYSMLFSPMSTKPVRFAEIGIAGGASCVMWNQYFQHPETKFHFFDRDENFLKVCASRVRARATFSLMDVGVDGYVTRALKGVAGDELFDVILDDSSHDFDHQIRIIREALPHIRPGGYMIVEDVFRATEEKKYYDALKDILPQCTLVYFVVTEHKHRWSPGWDNDKLLVLVKS